MKKRIIILGARFGGLELSTIRSDAHGDQLDIIQFGTETTM